MIPFGNSEGGGTVSAPPAFDDSLATPTAAPRIPGWTPLPTSLLVPEKFRPMVFPSRLVADISELAGSPALWIDPDHLDAGRERLAQTEILFSTWGMPLMDETFLGRVPKLKVVFYAAGSPKGFLTPAVFERGISVSTAAAANAAPVAEFTLATIIFSLKQVLPTMREGRLHRNWAPLESRTAGGYRSRVGLVSLGVIGQRVAESLKAMDLEVLAHDPYISRERALALGVKLTSLEDIFETCDVVSLHTPLLPSTEGMIGGALVSRLKPNATLINTSRGRIIRQGELCEILAARSDLTAILDVAESEPAPPDSPLWELPNIFLTPHISGSIGPECERMGRYMLEEFSRMRQGLPLQYEILPHNLALIA